MNFKMSLSPKQETTAILDIFDDIFEYNDPWTGEKFGLGPTKVADFLADNPAVDTIDVRINSNGGNVFDGIAIHNLLRASGKKVNVEVIGLAASIASVIAMAGDTVTMYPASQMMIHNCWTLACGNAAQFRELADQMDKIMESSKVAYLEKTGDKLTAEKLQALLDGESYLTAAECLELGLCDQIIQRDKAESEEPAPVQKLAAKPVQAKQTLEPVAKVEEPAPIEEEKEPSLWF